MMSQIEKYIQSILSSIYKKDDLDQVVFDLSLFSEHIGYNMVVKGEGDKNENRKTLILSKIPTIESTILKEYFRSLVEKDDMWLFDPGHFKMFVEELNNLVGKTTFFILTTAIELNPADLRALSEKLSSKMGRKVVIHLVVDKNILAGAIIKKDNFILDYSLKTKMNTLSSQWKKSIQRAG